MGENHEGGLKDRTAQKRERLGKEEKMRGGGTREKLNGLRMGVTCERFLGILCQTRGEDVCREERAPESEVVQRKEVADFYWRE